MRIGFGQEVYSFIEPKSERLFSNVTLIKEDNRRSEQTIHIIASVHSPSSGLRAATLRTPTTTTYDYRLSTPGSSRTLIFPPDAQSIALPIFINSDDFLEGIEAFEARIIPLSFFPSFQPPVSGSLFQNTEIRIIDDDCELFY